MKNRVGPEHFAPMVAHFQQSGMSEHQARDQVYSKMGWADRAALAQKLGLISAAAAESKAEDSKPIPSKAKPNEAGAAARLLGEAGAGGIKPYMFPAMERRGLSESNVRSEWERDNGVQKEFKNVTTFAAWKTMSSAKNRGSRHHA